jgi:hypothetical protein
MPTKTDETFWIINEHDTVLAVNQEQFDELYKPAGYRKLKDSEMVPVQHREILAEALARGIEPSQVFSDARFVAEDPDPDEIKRLRRERGARNN